MATNRIRVWYEVDSERTGRTVSFATLKEARVFRLIHGGTIYECTAEEVVKRNRKPVVSKA
jgi:hypothetical protein